MHGRYVRVFAAYSSAWDVYKCADSKARSYQQDISSLEASVKALEVSVAEIRDYIERENRTIPKARALSLMHEYAMEETFAFSRFQVEALLAACKVQSEDIQLMASCIPPIVPRPTQTIGRPPGGVLSNVSNTNRSTGQGILSHSPNHTTKNASRFGSNHATPMKRAQDEYQNIPPSEVTAGAIEGEKRRREVAQSAPRWHVTHADFDSISSYLKGRLTLDRVRGS